MKALQRLKSSTAFQYLYSFFLYSFMMQRCNICDFMFLIIIMMIIIIKIIIMIIIYLEHDTKFSCCNSNLKEI